MLKNRKTTMPQYGKEEQEACDDHQWRINRTKGGRRCSENYMAVLILLCFVFLLSGQRRLHLGGIEAEPGAELDQVEERKFKLRWQE